MNYAFRTQTIAPITPAAINSSAMIPQSRRSANPMNTQRDQPHGVCTERQFTGNNAIRRNRTSVVSSAARMALRLSDCAGVMVEGRSAHMMIAQKTTNPHRKYQRYVSA